MANPQKKPALPSVSPALQEAMETEISPAEVAERIENDATPEDEKDDDEKAVDPEKLAMMEREWAFDFEYTGVNKEVWKGSFKHTVPTVRVRRLIGIMRAEYAGGQAFESLDPLTAEIILILCYLSFTLSGNNLPDGHWSSNLEAIEDYEMLQELYRRCMAHEAMFLGPR